MSFWGPAVGFGASQVLGMFWYCPLLFGDAWAKIVYPGKSCEEIQKGMGLSVGVSMLGHGALSFILYHLYTAHLGVTTMSLALRSGLALSGVVVLSDICHLMFAKRPLTLFLIDQGFNAAVIMTMSAAIGFFV